MSTVDLEAHSVRATSPSEIIAVDADESVGEVLSRLRERRAAAVLVYSGEQLLGIFTERDALCFLSERKDLGTPIRDVMTPNPVVIGDGETVGAAIVRMSQGGFRHLPVVDQQGVSTSVASVAGILHFLVERIPLSVYNLPPNSQQRAVEREGA